jgi:periplasmic copper chaperone A
MKQLRIWYGLWVLALILASGSLAAHSYEHAGIMIGHVWSRATAEHHPMGAVYMPLLNRSAQDDALVSASSPFAKKVELHEVDIVEGIATMREVASFDLPRNKPVALRPKGKHLMLIGLKQPLRVGEKFPLTLKFTQAGEVTVEVVIEKATTSSPDH